MLPPRSKTDEDGDRANSGASASTSSQSNSMRMLLDATAGAAAGCISRFVVGPLDVIKIRFQVQLEPITRDAAGWTAGQAAPKYTGFRQAALTILKEEGIQGLWRGTVPGLLLTIPYTAVQFVALQQFKTAATDLGLYGHPAVGPWLSFAGGAFAGTAATLASYPFDLLRTTLAAQGTPPVHRGIVDATKSILRERGVAGLYSGLTVTLIEILPYSALQFGLYDVFNSSWATAADKRRAVRGGGSAPSMSDLQVQHFSCGLLAGLISKLVSHPLDVAKKRYQVAGLQRDLSYGARVEKQLALQAVSRSLVDIYTREGVRGLWKGSLPSIIKSGPSAAITFMAYEAILAWMLAAAAHQAK